MKLRKLEAKDAPLMLEWMHDPELVAHLGTNFAEKTLDDCLAFIEAAQNTEKGIHLAITDDADTYMGTVSLKHPDGETAEFAITVRSSAMGKGYAAWGMKELLRRGLEMGLTAIYWCVSPNNARAVRFYDKNGYPRTENVPEHIRSRYHIPVQWYVVTK